MRFKTGSLSRSLAVFGLGIWLVSTLALTVYPLDAATPPGEAPPLDLTVLIPFASTIEAVADSGDRPMTPEEYQAARERIARDFDIPIEEVELDPVFRGPGEGVILKDIVGNVLVFVGFGILVSVAFPAARSLKRVLLLSVGISLLIEASQAAFGLGIPVIDDVIYNAAGGLVGFALYSVVTPNASRSWASDGPSEAPDSLR